MKKKGEATTRLMIICGGEGAGRRESVGVQGSVFFAMTGKDAGAFERGRRGWGVKRECCMMQRAIRRGRTKQSNKGQAQVGELASLEEGKKLNRGRGKGRT